MNHFFLKNESGIFFAEGLDSRISLESAREIRFFAHVLWALALPERRNIRACQQIGHRMMRTRIAPGPFMTIEQSWRDLRHFEPFANLAGSAYPNRELRASKNHLAPST
jgi:hypothetical protein